MAQPAPHAVSSSAGRHRLGCVGTASTTSTHFHSPLYIVTPPARTVSALSVRGHVITNLPNPVSDQLIQFAPIFSCSNKFQERVTCCVKYFNHVKPIISC